MDFSLKVCIFYFIFLNLLVDTHAQDILSAILGSVQNGLNILSNNLGIGQRDYPDYGPANREVNWRSNDGSQLNQNQNNSEEPYNSNSESHQEGDSNSNSEEYDRRNENYIDNNKRFPIHNQNINNNKKDTSNKHPFIGNIKDKPIIRKPALLDNQKPPLEIDSLASNNSMYANKNKLNPNYITAITNNASTTASPIVLLVNSTIVDKHIANVSVIDSLINQNKLNSTHPVRDTIKRDNNNKTIKKDNNQYVLKALTKRKFYFQAKPVTPRSEAVDANETVFYIDFD